MKIISFLNHKGGVGKTTLCTNISSAIMQLDDPHSILLVDADPQGSLRDWHNANENRCPDKLNILAADRKNALSELPSLLVDTRFNYVVIDTPGNIKELHGAALHISDLVIIPIRPSPYDIWATEDTLELVKTAKRFNKNLKAAIVVNQAIPNTIIHKEVKELLKQYSDDFYIVPEHISHRVAFAKAASTGNTVYDTLDNAAIKEVSAVTNILLGHLFEGDITCP